MTTGGFGGRGTVLERFITEYVFRGDTRFLGQLEGRVDRVKRGLDSFARTAGIVGGVAAAGLGIVSKAGLGTEAALLRTRAALNLTEEQMRTLREESLRVGSALPLNTADIVNAQQAYGKLGATFEEILSDIPAIAGAAVATSTPVEEVAQYARIIQNVFGGDVTQNLNSMLRVANRSPATFRALGESLQFGGAAAVTAGLDFETYLATLGGMAAAGRGVESVSQGLTDIFGRLASFQEDVGRGGKLVEDAFGSLGFDLNQVKDTLDGTSEGFLRLLELIDNANLTGTELLALSRALAGSSYASAFVFAVENPDEIRRLVGEAGESAGDIERQLEIILQGASGGITKLTALVDTVLNRLSEFGALDGIVKFTGFINNMLTALTATDEQGNLVNETILKFINYVLWGGAVLLGMAFAAKVLSFVFGPLGWAIRGLLVLYGFLSSGTLIITGQLLGLVIAQKAVMLWSWIVAGALKAWTIAQWFLNVAMTANPIGAIIVGIALLIGLIAAAIIYWDEWTGYIRNLPTWVKVLMGVFGGLIAIIILIAAHWDKVTGAVKNAIDWMRRIPGIGRIFGSGDEPSGAQPPPGDGGALTGSTAIRPDFGGADLSDLEGLLSGAGLSDSDLSDLEWLLSGAGLSAGSAAGGPDFLSGLIAPLPVGIPPSASVPAGAGIGGPRQYTFGDLNLTVNAPGADSEEIAANTTRLIDDRLRRTVEAFDSQIDR